MRSCFLLFDHSLSSISHDVIHDRFKLTVIIRKKKKKRKILFSPKKEHSSRLLAGTDRETEASKALQTFLDEGATYFITGLIHLSPLPPSLKAYHHLNDPHGFVSLLLPSANCSPSNFPRRGILSRNAPGHNRPCSPSWSARIQF